MEFYSGRAREEIVGTHRFLATKSNERIAGERSNFANRGRFNYGYAPFYSGRVNLELIGGKVGSSFVDGVDVVFIARRPRGNGVVIVGWYRNARVYREMQNPTGKHPYLVRADVSECKLLGVEERQTIIPVTATSGPRSPALWYGTPQAIADARALMGGRHPKSLVVHKPIIDANRRTEIERRAIEAVSKTFARRGYRIASVERDRVGWDLEATNNLERLRLEVKGSAGTTFTPELTPNEFAMLQKYRSTYRLCIVGDVLRKPVLHEFRYSDALSRWIEADGVRSLTIEVRPGARLHFEKG